MGLEGAFGRIVFGRKGLQPTPSPALAPASIPIPARISAPHETGVLEQEVARHDLLERGVGRHALHYLATGDGREILERISTICWTVSISTHPAWCNYEERTRIETAINIAIARGQVDPSPALGRFMEIRVATRRLERNMPGSSHVPEQLRALYCGIRHGANQLQAQLNHDAKLAQQQIITLDRLHHLVRAAGGSDADLFDLLLGHERPDVWCQFWRNGQDFGELLQRHLPAFCAALIRIEHGRVDGLQLAQRHGRLGEPGVVAAMVATLGKGSAKAPRDTVISMLAGFDPASLADIARSGFATGDIETRHGLVDACARNGAGELVELLAAQAKVERAAKVKAAIDAVLDASQSEPSTDDAAGYTAIDGAFVAIPPAVQLAEVDAPVPTHAQRDAFLACIDAISQQRAEQLARQVPGSGDRSAYFQPFTPEEIDASFRLLTQGISLPGHINFVVISAIRGSAEGLGWYGELLDQLPLPIALRSLIGNLHGEVAKVVGSVGWIEERARFGVDRLRGWMQEGRIGVRELIAVDGQMRGLRATDRGEPFVPVDSSAMLRDMMVEFASAYQRSRWESPLQALPSQAVWPWLAENMAVFDEAFGLQPARKALSVERAIRHLALLPAIPARYYARLVEIGVAEKLPARRLAMALLRHADGLDARLEALLDDARQPVRINAATWLADIRAKASEAALRRRLRKEKSDPVRTALIEALQRLGADLSDLIGPASLMADAQAALAKGAINLPGWLPLAALPPVHFRDGAPVPVALVHFWLALAVKLKDPSATGQFGIYLDQLDPAGARALSGWVLESWIEYDTTSPTLDDANAHAAARVGTDWRWVHRTRTQMTHDQVLDALKREKLAEMANSGADTKGMLALACRADPVWAAQRVRWFLKKHGRRSNQAMALLDLLAGMGSPVTLQVVIAASVRLKQKSTQKHAAEIAERHAEDRGWSLDELADRTVPSAGFDDDGVLELPCGEDEKPYCARLDARLAIHLTNPEGKPVKTLPAGDDEASKESRKALSAAKKELAQVVEMQSARLFEAMCVERSWPVADWRNAFHDHPVMRRLIERLVWQGLDADGTPIALFRPTQEGDFTDADDRAVDLGSFDRVRLAHGALVDAATCDAWLGHLADYEVSPLIAQFGTTRAPLADGLGEATMIEDRKGWIADSLTYRGLAEKRGYERVMGDGGGCNSYAKSFPSRGLIAELHHSGSYAVDENNKVALKGLSFRKSAQYKGLKLKDVPPVMLAECWADFHGLAAKGRFDPEWEKICAW